MREESRGSDDGQAFERIVVPHLDAAYNLARWLVRNPQDAEDVVQEACLRALRFLGGYQGGDARSWVLRIVRNTAYSFLEKQRPSELAEEFDETIHVAEEDPPDAEVALVQSAESRMIQETLEGLPIRSRAALILRELEGLSYKEIAEVMEIPIGSVMSALARGRARLREGLLRTRDGEVQRGLRR